MQQKETFGERLARLREDKGLSRQKMADDLQISRASLEYYEKGKRKPDIDTLLKIAEYFKVTCDYLLKGVKTDNVNTNRITGLSDKAIEMLHTIKQQALGEYIPKRFKAKIAEIQALIDHYPEERIKEERERYEIFCNSYIPEDGEELPSFENWVFGFDKEGIELIKSESKREAEIILDTLSYIIEKDKFFDYMKMIYMYLFADIDETKGRLTGVVAPSMYSDDSFCIQLDKELLNESFLLKANSYLGEWKSRGNIKVFDLEMMKVEDYGNGNNPETK